jgi:S-DNA-T family DNA segregation ATPase FtsK/SpoIIIE
MEKNRYRVILSNKSFYKEIEISADVQTIRVGTGIENDVRLNKELFFEEFELIFTKKNDWTLICSDNLYISQGDARKLLTKEFAHGDTASVCYQASGSELFNIELLIDFDYEKKKYDLAVDLANQATVKIGGASDCQIKVEDGYIGNDSITIDKTSNGYVVTDRNTKYGVRVNGIKISEPTLLAENDFVSFAAFGMCLKGSCLYCDKDKVSGLVNISGKKIELSKSQLDYPRFNRNPRLKTVIPDEKIEILDPPNEPKKPENNIVLQLMPAIVMLAVTVVFRGLMKSSGGAYVWISVISMSLGVTTSVASIIISRKKYKTETAERIEKYTSYIDEKKVFIEECRSTEESILNNTYYSSKKEIEIVKDFSPKLFDRSVDDEDYLVVRLGNGKKEAVRELKIQKQERFNSTDELMDIPKSLEAQYKDVHNVPITLDLKNNNSVGVIGKRQDLYDFIKVLSVDLVVRQYYLDVQLFFLLDETDIKQFSWLRKIPHVQNEDLKMRNIVCDVDSKNILFDYLYKVLSYREASKTTYPNIVVFVYRDNGIKNHPISKYIDIANSVGVSFVFFEEHHELLPSCCDSVIQLEDKRGIVTNTADEIDVSRFDYELVTDEEADFVATKLTPVYCDEVSLEGTLTKNISLFELMNIFNVEDIDLRKNWAESEVYKSMAAPLGVKSKNQIVSLDLNEKKHGPHGLVAGTTGSGKSEILQSYILSMATRFHPYEVGFVIIDFKGGGMVNQFRNLPHLIGAITNIDGNEINRSLKSIKAELLKRQTLFAQADVNQIDKYIKLYKESNGTMTPLPHLILIVDEFAELKADQPEFMKELISAARIGRSLGVHLILATQKPTGVVDAQIWSNSKFKLCLKVQSKEDSNEVLKTPLAAEIKEPGRAYLQVGNNEIFELFQSAYSGAPAVMVEDQNKKSFVINQLDFSGKRTEVYHTKKQVDEGAKVLTQLDAIVGYIANYCEENDIKRLNSICMPPLPEVLDYQVVSRIDDSEIHTTIGLLDDPDHQDQHMFDWALTGQNVMILGSAQTGKTNVLQVIIRDLAEKYTPAEVNMYIIDFSSMILRNFSGLKHVGGVVCTNDDEKLKNFFKMMSEESERRKKIFADLGVSSFKAYKEAGKDDLPQILVFIDNLTALKELYLDNNDYLLLLLRDSTAVGITFIVANAQSSGIGYKYLSNFETRLALFCNNSAEYGVLFEGCRSKLPNVPGRALVQVDKKMFQIQLYLAFKGEKEFDRVNAIKEFVTDINGKYNEHLAARRIPEMPRDLTMSYINSNFAFGKSERKMVLGIGYETLMPISWDITNGGLLTVSGDDELGRGAFVKYIVSAISDGMIGQAKMYIFDDKKQLADYEMEANTELYDEGIDSAVGTLKEIEQIVSSRTDSDDLPWIVLIINNDAVIDAISNDTESAEIFKSLLANYKRRKVFIVAADIPNEKIGTVGTPVVRKIVKNTRNYVLFSNVSDVKLTDLTLSEKKNNSRELEYGDALYINDKGVLRIKTPRV